MRELTETVTITRKVDGRIADLVHFYQYVTEECGKGSRQRVTDDELVRLMDDWQKILNEDSKLMKAVLADKIKDIFRV